MRWFLELMGALFDTLKGPSITNTYEGRMKHEIHQLRPSKSDFNVDVCVQSRQIVYMTTYTRWWVPNHKRTVYEVRGVASDDWRGRLPEGFFDTVTYPLLCSSLLQWTEYPHVIAIHAFMDRLSPFSQPFIMKL